MRDFTLPVRGASNEILQVDGCVVVIGANGSGKSRLGSWIDMQSPQQRLVHRVSAHKSLIMPDSSTPKAFDIAEKELLYGHAQTSDGQETNHKNAYRWQSKPITMLLNDFEKLMVFLFSEHAEKSAQYLTEARNSEVRIEPPVTKVEKLKEIWEEMLPHRKLVVGGLDIKVNSIVEGSELYKASELSDGERVLFYLIGQCLAAPEGGIVVVDEPELHLHKSLHSTLWERIQAVRSDCLFVYLTHDVSFAAALHPCTRIWLKNYDGNAWEWKLIEDFETYPDEMLLEILGSRRPTVLVEGTAGSYDAKLYSKVLDDFLVMPSGGCENIITLVKGLNRAKDEHHLDVIGIVDRDRRSDDEVDNLASHNVSTINYSEVENIFLDEAVIRLVSSHLARSPDHDFESVREFVFERLAHELDNQISLHTAHEIQRRLSMFNHKAIGESAILESVESAIGRLDVRDIYNNKSTLFNEIIESKNYNNALKYFNRKSLSAEASKLLGLQFGGLLEIVIGLCGSASDEKMRSLMRSKILETNS